jgi:RimJ/RimL family protein N-acetyltransferase
MSAAAEMWFYSERGAMTPDESWARLLRHAGHWALMGYGIFAVEEKESGRLAGEAGFADFHRRLGPDFDPFPEASWTIRPEMQGRGYASEAARAATLWLEAHRGPTAAVCLIHRDNAPSLRVAEKLGFAPTRPVEYRGYPAILFRREVRS